MRWHFAVQPQYQFRKVRSAVFESLHEDRQTARPKGTLLLRNFVMNTPKKGSKNIWRRRRSVELFAKPLSGRSTIRTCCHTDIFAVFFVDLLLFNFLLERNQENSGRPTTIQPKVYKKCVSPQDRT